MSNSNDNSLLENGGFVSESPCDSRDVSRASSVERNWPDTSNDATAEVTEDDSSNGPARRKSLKRSVNSATHKKMSRCINEEEDLDDSSLMSMRMPSTPVSNESQRRRKGRPKKGVNAVGQDKPIRAPGTVLGTDEF